MNAETFPLPRDTYSGGEHPLRICVVGPSINWDLIIIIRYCDNHTYGAC